MNIELVGKDLPLSDMLKDRIETKLSKLESRLGQKLFVRVKLQGEQNSRFSCAINFNWAGSEFNATATHTDLIRATDESLSKIERQVGKLHQKADLRRGETIRTTT